MLSIKDISLQCYPSKYKLSTRYEMKFVECNSLLDVLDYITADDGFDLDLLYSKSSGYNNPSSTDWDFDSTYEKAVEFTNKGWSEGLKLSAGVADSLRHLQTEKTTPIYENSEHGLFFDMGAFISGVPEFCFSEVSLPLKQKEIILNVNIACSYSIKVHTMISRGGAIMALIKELKALGFVVHLNIFCSFSRHHVRPLIENVPAGNVNRLNCFTVFKFKIHTAGYIDWDELSFLVAHPAAFRRVLFVAAEKLWSAYSLGGYGQGGLGENELTKIFENIVQRKRGTDSSCVIDNMVNEYYKTLGIDIDKPSTINLLECVTPENVHEFGGEDHELSCNWVRKELQKIKNL